MLGKDVSRELTAQRMRGQMSDVSVRDVHRLVTESSKYLPEEEAQDAGP